METENTKQNYIVELKKPYTFEEKTYTEIDMSGIENIRAIDMIDANKELCSSGGVYAAPEMQMGYAMFIAARATGKPIEFFYNLPPHAAMQVRGICNSFFYGKD